MNWKEFLKPEWKKFVIFIIILIVSLISVFFSGCFSGKPCFIFPWSILANILDFFMKFGFLGFWPVALPSIIYWYLLSCLIVWIYDKLKKQIIKNYKYIDKKTLKNGILIIAIVIIICAVSLLLESWIKSLKILGPESLANESEIKNEFLNKMNVVVQSYDINSYEYYSYTSHDSAYNQSISIKDGKISYLKEEFIFYGAQERVCKKEFKNGNWIECSCEYSQTYCNYTSINSDFERKEKYLNSIKQLSEFHIRKYNITKQRTCYIIVTYDDFNKRYVEGNIYCFNDENLIVDVVGVLNDAVYYFYVENYSKDDLYKMYTK